MTPPSLAPPRPKVVPVAARPAARARVARPPWRPGGGESRVFRWSIAVSVIVHLLVLAASPSFIRVGTPPGDARAPQQPLLGVELGMRAPAEAASSPADAPAPDEAAPEEVSAPADPVLRAPIRSAPAAPARSAPRASRGPSSAAAAASTGATGTGSTATDALRPGVRDPRLWVAPKEAPPAPEPTEHERYMAHFRARYEALADSMATEAERERNVGRWTFKDKDGKEWGLSPGKAHIGGKEIPIPAKLPPGDRQKEDAAAERREQWRQIRDQQGSGDQRKAQDDARRRTRERKDAERKGGGKGS